MNRAVVFLLAVSSVILVGCKGPNRIELGYGFYELEEPSGKLVRRERDEDGKVVDRVWVEGYDGWVEGGSQVIARFDTRVLVQHFPDMQDLDLSDTGAQLARMRERSTYTLILLKSAKKQELGTIDDIIENYDEHDPVRMAAEFPYQMMGQVAEWLGEIQEKAFVPRGR
ncbi:MAG: hypothetical protein Phyf2KO_15640 [Phycisphaerales bacterium]